MGKLFSDLASEISALLATLVSALQTYPHPCIVTTFVIIHHHHQTMDGKYINNNVVNQQQQVIRK
jgi:hypothetical protein